MHGVDERAGGPQQTIAELRDQVRSSVLLIQQLVRANMQSLELARQLMLAQEVADLLTDRMHPAIDAAAASAGNEDAIDEAVAAVAAAEQASVAELTLSKSWGVHLGEVHRLIEVAQGLVERLDSV